MTVRVGRVLGEEGDGGGVGGAGQVDEVVDGGDALLGGGAQHGRHAAVGDRAAVAAVAARDLAVHDRGTDGLLGPQLDPFGQVFDHRVSLVGVEISGVEGLAQDGLDLTGGAPGPGRQVGDHFVGPAAEMGQTGLVGGLGVAAVGGPPVAHDGAAIVFVDDVGGLVEASAIRHVVEGDVTVGG